MNDEPLTPEEKVWIAWLLTAGVSFAILEGYAIRNRNTKGTLTYTLRKQLGIEPARPWKLFGTAVVCSASGWFAAHIVTGKLVPKVMSTIEEVKQHGTDASP